MSNDVKEFVDQLIKATNEGDLVWDVQMVQGPHGSERVYSSGMVMANGAVGNCVAETANGGRLFVNSHEYIAPAVSIQHLLQALMGPNPVVVEMATEALKTRMFDAECGSGRKYILNGG